MKLKTMCSFLCAIILLVNVCFERAVGQQCANSGHENETTSAPKYRVGFRRRTKGNPSILLVQISVAPKYFNRASIIALAQRLKKDFPREQQLNVALCDEYNTAKSPDLLIDLLRREPPLGLRGIYEVDRTSGKEGVSFSTERGKPLDEIDIDLSKSPLSTLENPSPSQ